MARNEVRFYQQVSDQVSHAAVIARELGIPALIGEPTASRRLVSGTMVTVNPRAGTVLPTG
jgi:phosphohistidine swiveling domain-containing protein